MFGTTLRDIDNGLSSKRIIVVTAFVAMTVFVFNRLTLSGLAPLEASDKVIFESLKWIVLGGLFAVTSERFSKSFASRFPAPTETVPAPATETVPAPATETVPAPATETAGASPQAQGPQNPMSEFLSSDDDMLDIKRITGIASVLMIVIVMCLKMMRSTLLPGVFNPAMLDLFLTEGFTYIVLGVLATVATEKFGSR